jgi:hypothetical protein
MFLEVVKVGWWVNTVVLWVGFGIALVVSPVVHQKITGAWIRHDLEIERGHRPDTVTKKQKK